MSPNDPKAIATAAARRSLLATTQRVGDSIPSFSTWLLAGVGATFSLLIANLEKVTQFIDIGFIKVGMIAFVISLILAVVATYLAAVVKGALAAQHDAEELTKELIASGETMDVNTFILEFQRGLLPHVRGVSRRAFEKALSGDSLAGARLIAKLSQVQALLVAFQSLLAVLGLATIAFGLKMQ
ncbi:MAG: hypothetical protein ACK5V0_09800 [Alphaproteobacteria bacterium]|jgi:hypothetical protein